MRHDVVLLTIREAKRQGWDQCQGLRAFKLSVPDEDEDLRLAT